MTFTPPEYNTNDRINAIRVTESHFAVVAGQPGRGPDSAFAAARLEFQGTAFAIASGVFVTAAHVIESARQLGAVSIARLGREESQIRPLTRVETFPSVDLAVGFAELESDVLPVEFRSLAFGEPVSCCGWALGPDPEFFTIVQRCFWGTVVTRRSIFRIGTRELADQPPGYELSFGIPGGLSGSPLISHVSGKVVGIAVGTVTHAQDEVVRQLGIAIDSVTLLQLRSETLGDISRVFGCDPAPARTPLARIVRNNDGSLRREDELPAFDQGWPET